MSRWRYYVDVWRFKGEQGVRVLAHSVWWGGRRLLHDSVRRVQVLPAVIGAVASIVVLGMAATQSPADIGRRYLEAARQSFAANDFAAAELYFNRLIADDESNTEAQYGLALLAQKQKNLPRTRLLMQRIAPPERRGRVAAHLWIARDLLQQQEMQGTDQSDEVERHLLRVVEQEPNNGEAASMLAMIYFRSERPERAIRCLEAAVETNPQLGLSLGAAYLKSGRASRAAQPLRRAAEAFRGLALANPDQIQARLLWAECELLQQNYQSARDILATGFSSTANVQYRAALVKALVAESDVLRRGDQDNLRRALELLDAAMKLGPGNPYVLDRWAGIARTAGPERVRIKAALNELLLQGKSSASIHLVLGTIATYEADYNQANQHFRLGLKQAPKMAALLNNYAWSLAHADPPELDRALALVNQALETNPQQADFLETRGQILAKLRRWDDAIVDLEAVISSAPNSVAARKTLAEAYTAIGRKELAEGHRARLQPTRQPASSPVED